MIHMGFPLQDKGSGGSWCRGPNCSGKGLSAYSSNPDFINGETIITVMIIFNPDIGYQLFQHEVDLGSLVAK